MTTTLQKMQHACGRVSDGLGPTTFIEACAAVADQMVLDALGSGAIGEVVAELQKASAKFPAMHSGHEGIAILREEYRELEDEVFWGKDPAKLREEAVQTAAMGLRFIIDICDRAS